ncbi:ribbon-helix-helix protein, CopG family [Candidatus Poribacteria bacterium]|nr:ribbon-helix-helix protein, CopG family [Candidatus Poribacteria bacterium]
MSGELIRVQFYLHPELKKELEMLALQCQISKSELIRQSIRQFLQEGKANEGEPLPGIIGFDRSGTDDISEKHDNERRRVQVEPMKRVELGKYVV